MSAKRAEQHLVVLYRRLLYSPDLLLQSWKSFRIQNWNAPPTRQVEWACALATYDQTDIADLYTYTFIYIYLFKSDLIHCRRRRRRRRLDKNDI